MSEPSRKRHVVLAVVIVLFHDRLESASRNIEGGRITRQWKVGLLREERLE